MISLIKEQNAIRSTQDIVYKKPGELPFMTRWGTGCIDRRNVPQNGKQVLRKVFT